MTQQADWAARLALVTATQLRRYRELRGLSAQQLADACTRLGHPIQRSVIANFENGRRGQVSTAEVIIFAAALEISPIYLIFPSGTDEVVEGLPGVVSDPYDWSLWFCGENATVADGAANVQGDRWPLDFVRELIPSLVALRQIREEIESFEVARREDLDALEALQEESVAADAAYEARISHRHELLNALELTPVGSDDYRQLRRELDEAKVASDEARHASEQARERVRVAMDSQRRYESMQQVRMGEEGQILEIITDIRKRRWSVPDFGPEFSSLFEEGAEVSPPARKLRRPRKRGGGTVEIGG
ncbi:helix-turn-helix domain-containing protein [Streptomyces sp. NPDC057677]|uniref:helix-turn-helix domain-containing protein n=1 Tax=unclassified Streptomyces TaxID=2593676 RepID=UPI00367D2DB2